MGARSFSVAGPLAWNSLPPEIKTLTLGQFSGHRLKTEMFLCVSAAIRIFIIRLQKTEIL